MLNKLKTLIISPIYSLKKIYYIFQSLYLVMTYNEENYKKEQTEFFSQLRLDREAGLKIFEKQQNEENILKTPMSSEHKVLLASISISKNVYKEILEIGTHDGKNAFYLSKIFPNSKITSIDLDEEDELFKNSYNREDAEKRQEFCKERDKILSLSKNINFQKMNSLKLYNSKKTFDLIWVDGAHGYPVASIDIINSVRLLNKKGLLLCDDVWKTKPLKQDETYHSLASYETLNALQDANILKFQTIYKRLDKNNNASKQFRKFIAIAEKLSDV